jgi:hypothetical protein
MFFSRSYLNIILGSSILVSAHPGHDLVGDILKRQDDGATNEQLCGIRNNNTSCDEGWCCGLELRAIPLNYIFLLTVAGVCGQGGYYCSGKLYSPFERWS